MKLSIEDCLPIINKLPVLEHGFTTKRETWINACEIKNPMIKSLNEQVFGSDENLLTTRKDCFKSAEDKTDVFILRVLHWGYSSGFGLNKSLKEFFQCSDNFKALIDYTSKRKVEKWDNSKGINISTLSKIWYFQKLEINNNPCLILDLKLIEIFKSKIFTDFEMLSYIKYGDIGDYDRYLDAMNKVRKHHDIDDIGKLEMFLFLVGDRLKAFANGN